MKRMHPLAATGRKREEEPVPPMKPLDTMYEEFNQRANVRLAERKGIAHQSFAVRLEARRANEEIGQDAMATVVFEALSTAERAIGKVDSMIDRLERIRLELARVATGQFWDTTERPIENDDLVRELGELHALLQTRRILAPKDETR